MAATLPGCGGAAATHPEPFIVTPPPPPPAGDPPPGPETPPPPPPAMPAFLADAFVHQRVPLFGAFPAGFSLHRGTLFASDADDFSPGGARIVPLALGGPAPIRSTLFAEFILHPPFLLDSNGQAPDPASPIGFGFFLNDFLIVSDTLGLALVSAGGSDSVPTLSNVVAFDPTSGVWFETFNLALPFADGTLLADSTGAPIPGNSFLQSQAEALAYVPHFSSPGGLLYVAMSNIVFGPPSFGTVKYPATIQVLSVNPQSSPHIVPIPAPGLVTETLRPQDYNPVALETIVTTGVLGSPQVRLLSVQGGTTAVDATGNLRPVRPSSIEVFDGRQRTFLGRFVMGLAGLQGRPALGQDAAGHRVGYFASGVNGEVYLLRLDGLYAPVVDSSRLAILRGPNNGIPISGPAGSPGGNVSGVDLSPDGRTLVVSGFGNLFATPPQPGRVLLLNLPPDVVSGSGFGSSFVPGSTEFASVAGRTLGAVLVHPTGPDAPEVYVNVGGAVDSTTFLGAGPASVGVLETHGLIR